jgi:hypothetical protein
MTMTNLVDVSDTAGSTSSVVIYVTHDYRSGLSGASVSHGQTTDGGRQAHHEFVDLEMAGVTLRVLASDVRAELGALYAASKKQIGEREAFEALQAGAFEALQAAAWALAGKLVRVRHLEAIAAQAYEAGHRDGQESLRRSLCALLGVES